MTKHTNTIGQCPHCILMFDAKKATLAFPYNITGKKISLVFALCPDCYAAFKRGNKTQQISIIQTSCCNILKNQNTNWTVTNSLVLDVYWGDFFKGWCYGLDIPKTMFDAIDDGLVDEIAFFPQLNFATGGLNV